MSVFTLPHSLTIRTICDVLHSIREWIGEGGANAVDGQSVQELDISGVQLLASLIDSHEVATTPLALINPSPELSTALQLAGLHDLLQNTLPENENETGNQS